MVLELSALLAGFKLSRKYETKTLRMGDYCCFRICFSEDVMEVAGYVSKEVYLALKPGGFHLSYLLIS